MEVQQALQQLEALGTEQNRKIYGRHGVTGEQYGVSFANLEKLRKQIKVDHALAEGLWASGNHDARVLATMIADPKKMTSEALDAWARSLQNSVDTDAFGKLAAGSPLIQEKIEQWTAAQTPNSEWVESAGWLLLALLAGKDAQLPDSYFERFLDVIERDIHNRKNRVRYAMNMVLIAIGIRNENLTRRALAAASKVGLVDVDHGETGCKTPAAAEYIEKTLARKRK
jgi:3-methyladenine DNA glycosylase AlkD